jgi:hypothetical protein
MRYENPKGDRRYKIVEFGAMITLDSEKSVLFKQIREEMRLPILYD